MRPIDPPPIVRLRIFEVHNVGTPSQREHELEQITYVLYSSRLRITPSHRHGLPTSLVLSEPESYAWMCHVDLFPMPTDPGPSGSSLTANQPQSGHVPSAPSLMATSGHSSGALDQILNPDSSVQSTPYGADPVPGLWSANRTSHSPHVHGTSDTVVAYIRGVPVFERSKRTVDLVGNTFSPSSCSKGRLIFVFSVCLTCSTCANDTQCPMRA